MQEEISKKNVKATDNKKSKEKVLVSRKLQENQGRNVQKEEEEEEKEAKSKRK